MVRYHFQLILKIHKKVILKSVKALCLVYIHLFLRVSNRFQNSSLELPGQGVSQSKEVSVPSPGHSSPPLWGGGLLQLLVRVTLLPPQDFAQADHADHSDH